MKKNTLGALPTNLQDYAYAGGTFALDTDGSFVPSSNGNYSFDSKGSLVQQTSWLKDIGNFLSSATTIGSNVLSSINGFVANNPVVNTSAGKSAYENLIESLLKQVGLNTSNSELDDIKAQLQTALQVSKNSGSFFDKPVVKYGAIALGVVAIIYFMQKNNQMLMLSGRR